MGQHSVEDIASIETVLHELLLRMEALERVHQQDVAHIRVSLDQWQEITQSLSRLLEVRTQETSEVSSGYRTLGEHLVRFSQYLVSSEVMLKRAEGPFTTLATSLPSLIVEMEKLGSQMNNDPQITTEVKAEMQALRRSIQRSASQRSGSGTSIWTELAQWRAAVVWLLMGTAVMGVLQYLIFRGSGFQAALTEVRASGGAVDRRLERIEIWLGIVEDD
jgi:chromosome segregation ATPase